MSELDEKALEAAVIAYDRSSYDDKPLKHNIRDAIRAYLAASPAPTRDDVLHIVFTDFPGPANECVFVEVETPDGRSIRAGEWRSRQDGLVELLIPGRAG